MTKQWLIYVKVTFSYMANHMSNYVVNHMAKFQIKLRASLYKEGVWHDPVGAALRCPLG